MEDVVSETFSTEDAPGWTPTGTAAWAAETHNVLDLSALQDILLQLDYTASFDFPTA